MAQILAGFLALMQLLTTLQPTNDLVRRMKSGELLRFHIIAQDDTRDMQHLKLLVRDAVQDCYTVHRADGDSMLDAAAALLPLLTRAAEAAAAEAGFTGAVDVTLGTATFDERTLQGYTIPAGEYPALVIRLGDARGQNWWGLLDPDTALRFAAVEETETPSADKPVIRWDWSWRGLLRALFGKSRSSN